MIEIKKKYSTTAFLVKDEVLNAHDLFKQLNTPNDKFKVLYFYLKPKVEPRGRIKNKRIFQKNDKK